MIHIVLTLAMLLCVATAQSQWGFPLPGSTASQTLTLFGPRALCPNPPWIPQADLHLHTEADPYARWTFGDCLLGPMAAGEISLITTPGNITALSQLNDFVVVANDTARDLRLAANAQNAKVHVDLMNPPGAIPTGMVDRMTITNEGRFDFRTGNWNCNSGLIRFEGHGTNESNPVIKLYRPTGTDITCPDPLSYVWWVHLSANPSAYEYTGALEFESVSTATFPGMETTTARMTLLKDGRVGINQREPAALFQVQNGSVMFQNNIGNTDGSTPASGAGVRLMWIPNKKAFRAGEALLTEWDNTAIGQYSWAGGKEVLAYGEYSFSFGEDIENYGSYSAAFGVAHTINAAGDWSFAAGEEHTINKERSAAFGIFNTVDAKQSFVAGVANIVGSTTVIDCHAATSFGHDNEALHSETFASGYGHSVNSQYSHAFGLEIDIDGTASMGMGTFQDINDLDVLLFGYGIDPSHLLTNTSHGMIEFGIESMNPTVSIRNSSACNTCYDAVGEVGIGVQMPENRLEIDGGVVIGDSGTYTGMTTVDADGGNRLIVQGQTIIGSTAIPVAATMLHVSGNIVATGTITPSDTTLKRDIESYTRGLEEILQIKTIKYKWKDEFFDDNGARHVGVRAQELRDILPDAIVADSTYTLVEVSPPVSTTELIYDIDSLHPRPSTSWTPALTRKEYTTKLHIRESDILYTLVNAVQELNARDSVQSDTLSNLYSIIDSLETRLDEVETRLATLESRVQSSNSSSKTQATDLNREVYLEQNRPNPFSETTEISYFIPENAGASAELIILGWNGQPAVPPVSAVMGRPHTVTVKVTDSPAGVYIYAISIDGRIVASKKMMVQR